MKVISSNGDYSAQSRAPLKDLLKIELVLKFVLKLKYMQHNLQLVYSAAQPEEDF